jgi:hypothetical protein
MALAWQESWEEFVKTLAEQVRSGVVPSDLDGQFAGETVTWRGTLALKELDVIPPRVVIHLLTKRIKVGQAIATLGPITVPVDGEAIEEWQKRKVKSRVTFDATFEARDSLLGGPVEVKLQESGAVLVTIRLRDAVPR